MRPVTEATFVSLDGVVESPERLALPFWGPEQRASATEQLATYDAFLFGRVTYEKFAAAWGPITGDPYYDAVKRLPKFVASKTLTTTTWNATLLQDDTVAAVRALKEQPGKGLIRARQVNSPVRLADTLDMGKVAAASAPVQERPPEAEPHLREVLESHPVPFVRLDGDGTFLAVNEQGLNTAWRAFAGRGPRLVADWAGDRSRAQGLPESLRSARSRGNRGLSTSTSSA